VGNNILSAKGNGHIDEVHHRRLEPLLLVCLRSARHFDIPDDGGPVVYSRGTSDGGREVLHGRGCGESRSDGANNEVVADDVINPMSHIRTDLSQLEARDREVEQGDHVSNPTTLVSKRCMHVLVVVLERAIERGKTADGG